MPTFKSKQPRAGVPFCWICDRRLYGGGKFYAEVIDDAGYPHPAHKTCANEERERLNPKEHPEKRGCH